jgi:excisionase family DNA binding protein
MTDRLLTPADAAERCQISTKTVLRAIHRGRLRASRLGEHGAYRMHAADVDAWIEASMLPAPPVQRPATQAPLRAPAEPSSGRLVLTPEMGRH